MKTDLMPSDLWIRTDEMLDRLAARFYRFAGFYLGQMARFGSEAKHARALAYDRQQKLRLLCDLRMLFERDDLPS